MTFSLFLVVMLCGGLGAICRFLVDSAVKKAVSRSKRWSERWSSFPAGTFVVNLTACLLVGFVAGLASSSLLPAAVATVVSTGFLGGYSTFSTASVEGYRLIISGKDNLAFLYCAGMLLASQLLAAAGYFLASLF